MWDTIKGGRSKWNEIYKYNLHNIFSKILDRSLRKMKIKQNNNKSSYINC